MRANPDICVPTELIKALGSPRPPTEIWQKAFDYIEGHCQRLVARKQPADPSDIIEYFLDYQYMEVQEDLFRFILPVALEAWARDTLDQPDPLKFKSKNISFEGMWDAINYRPLHPEFVDKKQIELIQKFSVTVLLELMGRETRLSFSGSGQTPYEWFYLHGTLVNLFPVAQSIWSLWWDSSAPGHAICSVQWLASLFYEEKFNPVFEPWTPKHGGGAFHFEESLLTNEIAADASNTDFFEKTLTHDWGWRSLNWAAAILRGHPQYKVIEKMLVDFEGDFYFWDFHVGEFLESLQSNRDYKYLSQTRNPPILL
ncbi:MAG: hypothetical protein GY947_00420 [Rhodobacteraceae bacterium]|nr:hypothetical protein [Paracoccaceae bacterium]